MKFVIQHQTSSYMRLRLCGGRFTGTEAEVLEYALSNLKGVSGVRLYPASGGIAFSYKGDRDTILKKLRNLQFHNVKIFAEELEESIGKEELARRKLSPELKRKLRCKVIAEAAADMLLPAPVQLGYHMYQLVTLKNL
jgi:hypothetical protein